ncbi:mitochondrial calcium uniporter regulator 1-like [Saccoglossus kowalevskii]|uniref:Mitochondrial calcium uniporter regulator 1-like n=1 Tax=Saccoglossus kowalevskii TaxID=10224 RepID=A0ABM0LW37_SACKO|nr:PREDICTED: mitochondrial calcium uniporter regulator 1-like [Saccoglossus kowalevskii]
MAARLRCHASNGFLRNQNGFEVFSRKACRYCHINNRSLLSIQYASCEPKPLVRLEGKRATSTVLHERNMCYDSRDVALQTPEKIDYYFDTHALVKIMDKNGFSESQAECLISLLVKIINKTMNIQKTNSVTKAQQEIMLQQVMSHIASVKKDMVILEKSEFSALRNENEKLVIEAKQIKENLKDEVVKMKSSVSLDLNLERSRAKDVEAELRKSTELIDKRIDTEIANVKAFIESNKYETLKYMGGTIVASLGVVLTFWRLFMV